MTSSEHPWQWSLVSSSIPIDRGFPFKGSAEGKDQQRRIVSRQWAGKGTLRTDGRKQLDVLGPLLKRAGLLFIAILQEGRITKNNVCNQSNK